MAGIGLRLERLVTETTYSKAATAYLSSAIISAGPWLSAVLSLALLGWASAAFLGQSDRQLLFATVTYAFISSLVLTGGLQLIATRYIADRFFIHDRNAIAPTCSGTLLTAVPLLVLTLPFLILAPFALRYRLLAADLFVALSLIWLAMVFLSATRDYLRVVGVFVVGYVLGLGTALWLGHLYGLLGSLTGFTFGQGVLLMLLVGHVYREFPSPQVVSFAFLAYGRTYWNLVLIGFLYNLGIWVDNVIYWWSPHGVTIANFFRLFPTYDSAKLAAYLLTIPAAAVFLVHLETNFYRYYREFYQTCILHRGTLKQFMHAKQGMVDAARKGMATLLKLQGFVALCGLLLAPELAGLLGLPSSRIPLVRIEVLAASAQFLLLAAVLFLLYLDARPVTLLVSGIFIALNAGLTVVTVGMGLDFYGLGYLVATTLGAVTGWTYLRRRLRRLEYLTFMSQPIVVERRRG